MNATICLFLAGALHCQDVSLSGILDKSPLSNGEGARLCVTGEGYLNCKNVSQAEGLKLIRQHECEGAKQHKEAAEIQAKIAEGVAESHRKQAAKWPNSAKQEKRWEADKRLEIKGLLARAEGASKRIEHWCTD
jgi:hypothetical protein